MEHSAAPLYQHAEFWVGAAFLVFAALLTFLRVPQAILGLLDSRGKKIQDQLDEATRLREEAQALLAEIKTRREETERTAQAMLASARTEAERLRTESRTKLEEQIARRTVLAERRIATAEAQAAAEVKGAAADLAAAAAERVLSARLSAGGPDPLVDAAIGDLRTRLQ
jgi:F-type H+-transporting ATPase subunit b